MQIDGVVLQGANEVGAEPAALPVCLGKEAILEQAVADK